MLHIILGCKDLDLAIQEKIKPVLVENVSQKEIEHLDAWEKSNRICKSVVKARINKRIRSAIPEKDIVAEYLAAIEEHFVASEKVVSQTLLNKLANMRLANSKSVRDHILEMKDISDKHNSLGVIITDPFLVTFILTSLPSVHGPFNVSYNTQKES
ncbi:PREDICTED: uncharacterized protein LOC104602066 [Nelumbo nucifera]|uniref:Uncharacterized protein LOC104602066 n=1 Tax=Nelumbo nucifera TaxID=4432 RepID=A0A1U8A974_NELNU|nr:PREDICTED: uncharacterized protein LOC104602066 [Nelumbo nucifera]